MSLIDSMKEQCTMIDRRSMPDGMGGFKPVWVDGAQFLAAIVKDSTMQARVAEKQGVTEVYTVTVDKGMPLEYHDVFRRNRDGAVFRVTSNIVDSQTPKVASFQFGQVTAERWVLPQ
jgi:hypothetical protein